MSAPINVTEVRLKVSDIIHDLGFVIDFCECAVANNKVSPTGWPDQVLEDCTNAGANVLGAKERLTEIEFLISDAMELAEKAVRTRKRRAKR